LPGVRRLEEPIGVSSMSEEPSTLEIEDVLELNDQEVYMEFRAVYGAEIFGYLFKTDAFSLSEDSDVYITDIDWNEHYAEVGVNLELRNGDGSSTSHSHGDCAHSGNVGRYPHRGHTPHFRSRMTASECRLPTKG
jgi:hypothetical protein